MTGTHKAIRYFLTGQALLFASVLINILILPEGLTANDGMSYYSGQAPTALIYIIGTIGCAWFAYKTARCFPNEPTFQKFMYSSALILVLLAPIPYGINNTFEELHTVISAGLFVWQFIFAGWAVFGVIKSQSGYFLYGSLAAAGLLAIMYLAPRRGFLIGGEIAFQLIFAAVICLLLTRLSFRATGETSGVLTSGADQ